MVVGRRLFPFGDSAFQGRAVKLREILCEFDTFDTVKKNVFFVRSCLHFFFTETPRPLIVSENLQNGKLIVHSTWRTPGRNGDTWLIGPCLEDHPS